MSCNYGRRRSGFGNINIGLLGIITVLVLGLSVAARDTTMTFDFDGDLKADIGSWHGVTSQFKVQNSNGGSYSTYTMGSSNAKPVPGDYDGDGKKDAAVFDGN